MNPLLQSRIDEVVTRYLADAAIRPRQSSEDQHTIELLAYEDEASLQVAGEESITLAEHHELLEATAHALRAAGVDAVEYRTFDLASYRAWLGDRADTRPLRAQWISLQPKFIWSFVIGKGRPGISKGIISEAIRKIE
jgi:hypothetical protein